MSPHRQLIEDDVRFLQDLGATTTTGSKEGIRPRMVAFFRKMAADRRQSASFQQMRPVLEYIARSYPPAWLLLAELCSEGGG